MIEVSLIEAMHLPADSDTIKRIHEFGMAVANEDTMSKAIHDVYCGIMADHDHPNEKDHAQAKALIDSLQKAAVETPEA